jgi:hypothetical protein
MVKCNAEAFHLNLNLKHKFTVYSLFEKPLFDFINAI